MPVCGRALPEREVQAHPLFEVFPADVYDRSIVETEVEPPDTAGAVKDTTLGTWTRMRQRVVCVKPRDVNDAHGHNPNWTLGSSIVGFTTEAEMKTPFSMSKSQ